MNRPSPVRPPRLVRGALVALGVALMVTGIAIGLLPGPGFLIVFPIGLALVLRNATWSKRLYLRARARYPHYGRWTDWALRRQRHRDMPPLPRLRDLLRRRTRTVDDPGAPADPPAPSSADPASGRPPPQAAAERPGGD